MKSFVSVICGICVVSGYLFISFTVSTGFMVISAQAGMRPLLTAFLTDLMLDQAVQ
jgi:hypothetical protein